MKKRNIPATIIILTAIIIIAGIIFLPQTKIIGQVIGDEGIEYSKTLNLQFSQSTEYKVEVPEKGQLISLKITGSFKNNGTGKISFQNKTIIEIKEDATNGQSFLTGLVINNETEVVINETNETEVVINETNETEVVINETNETEVVINETNETEVVTEEEEEIIVEETIEENETEVVINETNETIIENTINFESKCTETCNIKDLNYFNQTYLLNVEITGGTFIIDELFYTILSLETPKEKISGFSVDGMDEIGQTEINETELEQINENAKKAKIEENKTMNIIKISIISIIIIITIIALIKQKNPKKKKHSSKKKSKTKKNINSNKKIFHKIKRKHF